MNILNLRDWDVQEVKETEGGYEVLATYRPQPAACTSCGVVGELYRHGTTDQVIHDVPTLGRPMAIHALSGWGGRTAAGRLTGHTNEKARTFITRPDLL